MELHSPSLMLVLLLTKMFILVIVHSTSDDICNGKMKEITMMKVVMINDGGDNVIYVNESIVDDTRRGIRTCESIFAY